MVRRVVRCVHGTVIAIVLVGLAVSGALACGSKNSSVEQASMGTGRLLTETTPAPQDAPGPQSNKAAGMLLETVEAPALERSDDSIQDAADNEVTESSGEHTTEVVDENANQQAYQIVPEASEVRFRIDETLFGIRKTVVGRTNKVMGEIRVDLANPVQAMVGPVVIDVRSLKTDESFRDRSLRRRILESQKEAYRFVTFEPIAVDGLVPEVIVGKPVTFQITGNLTVRDVTKPVIFDMTVMAASETRLEGSGMATIRRSDFDLQIPRVPGVANVSEEVGLEIDFVAEAVNE